MDLIKQEEGARLVAVTVNTTVLTRSTRLADILRLVGDEGVDAVALQETRHPTANGFPWANQMLAQAGWAVQRSDPPPAKEHVKHCGQ